MPTPRAAHLGEGVEHVCCSLCGLFCLVGLHRWSAPCDTLPSGARVRTILDIIFSNAGGSVPTPGFAPCFFFSLRCPPWPGHDPKYHRCSLYCCRLCISRLLLMNPPIAEASSHWCPNRSCKISDRRSKITSTSLHISRCPL